MHGIAGHTTIHAERTVLMGTVLYYYYYYYRYYYYDYSERIGL